MTAIQKKSATPPQMLPLSVLRMVWKRKLFILGGWVLLSALSVYYVYQLADVYRAEAVVVVDSQKIPEKFVSSTIQVSLQDSLNAIKQQVLNSGQLERIVQEFNLYEKDRLFRTPDEIIAIIRSDLTVELEKSFGGGRSGTFRITYEGKNPSVVAGVVDRVTGLFIRENLENREERAQGTSEFLAQQLVLAKKRLEQQEAALSTYKVKWVGELPQQEQALLGALARLNNELLGNQEAIGRTQQNKVMLENTLRLAESSLAQAQRAAIPPAAPKPPAPQPLAPAGPRPSQILQGQLDAARARYFEEHPEVKRLKAQLAETLREDERQDAERARLAAVVVEVPPTDQARATEAALQADVSRERERVATTRTQLQLVDKELDMRNLERSRIVAEINDYQKRVEKLPIREQQMAALTRDYETSKQNYQSLLDKKNSAAMASDMERSEQSERFTVADPARVPDKPVKPRRAVLYLTSSMGSLLLCLVLAVGLEARKGRFLGEWELPKTVAILGRIPQISYEPLALAAGPGGTRNLLAAPAASPSSTAPGRNLKRLD